MKKFFSLFIFSLTLLFVSAQKNATAIDQLMTKWHHAAAVADFNTYFGLLHEKSVFMGTDATERWSKTEFISFAKPFFDKKRAWDFTAIDRHINFSQDGKMAWIDEILDTKNMSLCRGSGVLILENRKWKIMQYVLSMTIPNALANDVTKMKTEDEKSVIEQFRSSGK